MKRVVLYAVLFLLAAVLLVPLYWTLIGSFLSQEEFDFYFSAVSRGAAWFTLRPSLEQYAHLLYPEDWMDAGFLRSYSVSLLSASAMTALHLLIVPVLGFYLAKQNNRFTRFLFFFVVLTMLAPLQITMTPTLILAKQLRIDHSWWAILLPSAAMPFGIFLTRQFIRSLPDEILDAARLDTDSVLTVLYRLVIPFSAPALCALLLLSFLEGYGMIEQPLILLDPTTSIMPLSVEMNSIYRLFPSVIFAASVLFVFPCLLLYLCVRKPMIKTMRALTL